MATSRLLDLRRLLGACGHLARRAGRIIREVQSEGQLGAHNKKADGDTRSIAEMAGHEVLTVADGRAQDAIVTSLRHMFPGIRLVGEEGDVPVEATPTQLGEVPELPADFVIPEDLARSATLADTCLWIDPLDGTKEFVLGNLENVSVLIGVAVKDTPVAGVIHKPFIGDAGLMTYGAVGAGVHGDETPAFGEPPSDLVILADPKSIEHPRFKAAVEQLDPKPQVVSAHACGQILLRVVRGEASAFVRIGGGPSRWDTCAGEGLLLALGGKVTNIDGIEYKYVEAGSHDNSEGLIATRTPEIHARLLAAFAPTGEPPAKRQCA